MKNNPAADMAYEWTAQEIEERLGASTIAFPLSERIGAREIAQMRQAGITRIEIGALFAPSHFDYRDRDQVSEIVSECHNQGISIVSFHGPIIRGYPKGPLLGVESEDEEERKAAVAEAVFAARVAEEMGASIVVGHFGFSAQSEKTVTEMLHQFEGSQLRLANENGHDLADYVALVDRIGSDRFGMVVDVGHTRDPDGGNPFIIKERARKTMAQCGPRLIHLHLHDYIDMDHYAPFDGNLQWDEVFAAFRDIDYQGLFMFEGGDRDQQPDHILSKTAEFPRTFVERYGHG